MSSTRTPPHRNHDRLLRGEGSYVADVNRAGQLWMAVVRSPVAHGLLRGVDRGIAAAIPGVHAVLTADDLAEVPVIPIRVLPRPGLEQSRQPVIVSERVRYVGEPVAIVVADDPYIAEDAAELVELDIEPLPPALSATRGQPALWDAPIADNVTAEFHGVNGDIDAAFAEAAIVVEVDAGVQRHGGVPMETRGLVAEWTDDGELHVWGVTKFLHFTRATLAGFFGIEDERVICHRVDVGGMFGPRGEVYPEDFLVPWAARLTGRPVKWIEDRREHFVAINHSREHRQRISVAVASDGRFLGLRSDSSLDMGAYARPIGARLLEIAVEMMPGAYQWPALDIRARFMATNKTPVGTMRGPCSFETTFVRERVIDIAAARLGISPVEIRRRNLIRPEQLPYKVEMGPDMHAAVYDTGDYGGLLTDLLEQVRYDEMVQQVADRQAAGELVGIGIATFVEHSGLGFEEPLELELGTDGRFTAKTTAADVGQGLDAMVTEVVARALGVASHEVDVLSGDSRAPRGGRGTFNARSTIFIGSAAHNAALLLDAEAVERAADMLHVPAAELSRSAEGFAHGDEQVPWKAVAPIQVMGKHQNEGPTWGFGVHLAVVKVDPDTGGVQVERIIIGFDCGEVIDTASVQGQLIGAAIMGIGGTLLEELNYDEAGQPQCTTFVDYLMPTAAESPMVETHLFNTAPVPSNPLGVRGVGEAGIAGIGGAVANATAAALGTNDRAVLTELPLKPATVIALCP